MRKLTVVLMLMLVFPLPASGHSATHHHSGTPHNLTLDGTNTAHIAFLTACEWIDNTRGWKRREWHQHYSRPYPGAAWVFLHGVKTGGLAPCNF